MALKTGQRWLVLAHAFNMDGRAASQTITDKLPHLRAAGIEVVVLSGVSGTPDKSLEHHQLWPMGPAGFRFELRHVLRRRWGSGLRYRLTMTLVSFLLLPFMLLEKILRPVESSWSWWLSAYLKGRSLARHRPFDLIYSTGGAFAAHWAGDALKKATGTPWLAEVHDPMVAPGTVPSAPQQTLQAEIERRICAGADVAIWFTDQALASAMKRHPQRAERGKMMLPGVDRPFVVLPPYRPGEKFVIGHFGSLSVTRNLAPVIGALEHMVAGSPDLLRNLELHVYGGPLDMISSDLVAKSAVGLCVHHHERVEADAVSGLSGREQILHKMRSVDVLLLLHGEDAMCSEYIPSKLYEYLWMQRPIVAVVHDNPQMADMVRFQGHVAIFSNAEMNSGELPANQLATALDMLYFQWRTSGLPDNGKSSAYTVESAVNKVITWVNQLPQGRK